MWLWASCCGLFSSGQEVRFCRCRSVHGPGNVTVILQWIDFRRRNILPRQLPRVQFWVFVQIRHVEIMSVRPCVTHSQRLNHLSDFLGTEYRVYTYKKAPRREEIRKNDAVTFPEKRERISTFYFRRLFRPIWAHNTTLHYTTLYCTTE
jgi:hypothetical protein